MLKHSPKKLGKDPPPHALLHFKTCLKDTASLTDIGFGFKTFTMIAPKTGRGVCLGSLFNMAVPCHRDVLTRIGMEDILSLLHWEPRHKDKAS